MCVRCKQYKQNSQMLCIVANKNQVLACGWLFLFSCNVPYFRVQKSRSCLDSYSPTKYIFFSFMSPPRAPLFHAFCFSTQKRIGRMKQAGGNALFFNENVLFFIQINIQASNGAIMCDPKRVLNCLILLQDANIQKSNPCSTRLN